MFGVQDVCAILVGITCTTRHVVWDGKLASAPHVSSSSPCRHSRSCLGPSWEAERGHCWATYSRLLFNKSYSPSHRTPGLTNVFSCIVAWRALQRNFRMGDLLGELRTAFRNRVSSTVDATRIAHARSLTSPRNDDVRICYNIIFAFWA